MMLLILVPLIYVWYKNSRNGSTKEELVELSAKVWIIRILNFILLISFCQINNYTVLIHKENRSFMYIKLRISIYIDVIYLYYYTQLKL